MRFGKVMQVMRHRRKATIPVIVALLACIILGASFTGSYFSDTHNGDITGTVGSIQITPGGSLNLAFSNLLPGVPQTVSQTYTNTGSNPQDVYLVFPNATALSTLNNLGTYGSVEIDSNGTSVFSSQNLNDHPSCPPGSTAGGNPPCAAVPSQIELASNVQPGADGSFSFTFAYAGKLTGTGGGDWNVYPGGNGPGQETVNASDGTGSGLPYELVAVQVGQTP